MLVGSKVSSRKDHLARQSMKMKNRRKTVSLLFRAVVKSVYYPAQGDPTDELRVDPADAMTRAPHEMRGTSRCVREFTDPRSPTAWKIDHCYRASRQRLPIPLFSHVASLTSCPKKSGRLFRNFARASGLKNFTTEILDPVSSIPYAQADGLGSSITRILKTMQREIHAKDPQAINSAVSAVIAVTRTDVQEIAQAGRIVVR
jgi:hypothetical protein